jgi:protein-tyrosine phosphatase
MKTLLVLCTGNIYRSPLVAALVQQRLAAANLAGAVEVISAGIFAIDGAPADPTVVTVLRERGIDIAHHRAHTVTIADLNTADLILVMEEAQRQSIFYRAPQLLYKVVLLSELSGRHVDVPDPVGQSPAVVRTLASAADGYIQAGWPMLLRQLGLPQANPGAGSD